MAENAGFLSSSFLKKERETVLTKFSPNLQKVAQNNNSLRGCWILYMHEIFPMLLLQKYEKLLPGTLWITYLLFRRKQLKSGTATEPVRCHPATPLLKVQEVIRPGEGPSLHFALIYKIDLEDEIHKHLLFLVLQIWPLIGKGKNCHLMFSLTQQSRATVGTLCTTWPWGKKEHEISAWGLEARGHTYRKWQWHVS